MRELTVPAFLISGGIAVWAIYEIRQKNKLERKKLEARQEAGKKSSTNWADPSAATTEPTAKDS